MMSKNETVRVEGSLRRQDILFVVRDFGVLISPSGISVPQELKAKKFYKGKVVVDVGEGKWEYEVDVGVEPERTTVINQVIASKLVFAIVERAISRVELDGAKFELSIDAGEYQDRSNAIEALFGKL